MLINPLYQPVAGHDFTDVIADYPLGIIVGSELMAAHLLELPWGFDPRRIDSLPG